MSKTRTLDLLVLFSLIGLLLAGCLPAPPIAPAARPTTRRPAPPDNAEAPTTIAWSFWGDSWEFDVNRRLAQTFEAENPSIKVQIIHKPYDEYFPWIEEEWRQGRSPDVMFLDNIRGRAAQGRLASLDTYLQRDRFDLADFYPRLLELFNYQGSYYGLPRDNDTKVIYYNKTLFAEAGLDPPKSGWTWTDLRNLASRLTRRDGVGRPLQYGFAFEARTWWRAWVWQNGGDILDDPLNPTRVRLGEPAAVDALQFLADLINADRVTPPPDVLLSSDRITELFRTGKLAMAFGNHTKVPVLTEEPGLKWDVVGLPAGRQRVNLAGGAGYTISAQSEQKNSAWALVRFLESPKGQALFAESGLIVPARRSIRDDNIFLRQQPYDVRVFSEETELGRPNLNIPQAGEINRLAEAALEPVWRGERSPADAAADLVPQLRPLVER